MKIYTIDTYHQTIPRYIAVYLIFGSDGPVLVETGPGSVIPAVVEGIKAHGVQPGDIKHVLVTHIHLDHAGAAGWWAHLVADAGKWCRGGDGRGVDCRRR